MKAHNYYWNGQRVTESWNSKGESLGRTVWLSESRTDQLVVADNSHIKGDFRTPNAFSFTKTRRGHLQGRRYGIHPNGVLATLDEGNLGIGVNPFNPPVNDVYNEALSEINEKIRAGIDWSVTLGQGAQVGSMVQKAMATAAMTARAARRFDFRAARRAYNAMREGNASRQARALGGKWLEYQYGWKPLAQDIYNTATELMRDFSTLVVVEARKTQQTQKENVDWLNGLYAIPVAQDASFRCHMKFRFKPSSSATSLISNFTSMNPASIAWELVPYSFVVDWFYDLGGYMRNLETSLLMGNRFVDGFITTSSKISHTVKCSIHGVDIGSGFKGNIEGNGYHEVTTLVRSPQLSMPFPRAPVFKSDLGSGRLLNAAALLSQHLGR